MAESVDQPAADGEAASIPTRAEVVATLTAPGGLFTMDDIVVRGVPLRAWTSAPATLRAVLESSGGHGDAVFLVYEDERVTFAEHSRIVAELGRRLIDRFGVQPGDRVAIAMRNLPEWVMAFWATIAVGAVAVPLNAWWTGEELAYGLADSDARVVFVDEERQGRITHHLGEIPGLQAMIVTCEEHDPDSGGRRPAVGCLLDRHGADPLPVVPFHEVVGTPPDDATLPDIAIDPDDDATIFYTSGTTGRPKGAVGTHRNSCSNLMNLFFVSTVGGMRRTAAQAAASPGGQNANLLSVPLFHATGCHALLVTNTAAGGQDRHDAPLRSRTGARAHRARADHRLRWCPGHGHAGDRLARLRQAGHLVGAVHLLRRSTLPARPGPAHQGALPDRSPRQRLRTHRDLGHDHHEHGRRLRAQAGQRRSAVTGVRCGRGPRALDGRGAPRPAVGPGPHR